MTVGDGALICQETSWRNGRRPELYPHAKSTVALSGWPANPDCAWSRHPE